MPQGGEPQGVLEYVKASQRRNIVILTRYSPLILMGGSHYREVCLEVIHDSENLSTLNFQVRRISAANAEYTR